MQFSFSLLRNDEAPLTKTCFLSTILALLNKFFNIYFCNFFGVNFGVELVQTYLNKSNISIQSYLNNSKNKHRMQRKQQHMKRTAVCILHYCSDPF